MNIKLTPGPSRPWKTPRDESPSVELTPGPSSPWSVKGWLAAGFPPNDSRLPPAVRQQA